MTFSSIPTYVLPFLSPRELEIINKKEREKRKDKNRVVSSTSLFESSGKKSKGNKQRETAFLSRFVVQTEALENVQCERCKNSYHMGKGCGAGLGGEDTHGAFPGLRSQNKELDQNTWRVL
jgi:hypothetical protein